MATNVDKLFVELTEYRMVLEKQNTLLSEEFRQLEESWMALRQDYEGRAADEFAHAWESTTRWFENYFEQLHLMTQFISERAENLPHL